MALKYFSALADAEFARAAFTAAGLDFDALKTAKNTDAIKAAVSASAKPSAEVAELDAALAEAAKENKILSDKLAALETEKAVADEAEKKKAEAAKAEDKNLAASEARKIVALAGHPGVAEKISAEPTQEKREVAAKVELKGSDRYRADFDRQLKKLAGRN